MQLRHITNNVMDGPRLVAAVTRIGMIAFLVLATIMWGINIWGNLGVNFAFAFIAFFLTIFMFVSPKATVPWLTTQAVAPKVAEEIHQVLLKILLSFMLTAIFLATWSFAASPWSFWALFTLLLALLTWQLINKANTNITKRLQLGYILVCIVLVLLKSMGLDLGSKVDASTLESLGDRVTAASDPVASTTIPGASSCPQDNPCVAYDGYRVTLGRNQSLTINQEQLWETGMDVKVINRELRATMHDSELFQLGQPSDSNVVTITPVASGFARAGTDTIELVIYPRGEGDRRVQEDFGRFTPDIDLTAR